MQGWIKKYKEDVLMMINADNRQTAAVTAMLAYLCSVWIVRVNGYDEHF